MEGYILKLNLSLHPIQRFCILFVLDIWCDIHDLHETLVTAVAVLELFCEVYQFFDRFRKVIDIKKEGHQIRRGKFPFHHQPRAHQKRSHRDQRGKYAHPGVIRSHIPIRLFLGIHKPAVSLLELVHLRLFVAERFDHTDAGKTVLDLTVDIRDSRPVLPERSAHPAIHCHGIQKHNHNKADCNESQFRIDHQKNDKCTQQFDCRNHHIFRSVV